MRVCVCVCIVEARKMNTFTYVCMLHRQLSPVVGVSGVVMVDGGGALTAEGGGAVVAGGGRECDRAEEASFWTRFCCVPITSSCSFTLWGRQCYRVIATSESNVVHTYDALGCSHVARPGCWLSTFPLSPSVLQPTWSGGSAPLPASPAWTSRGSGGRKGQHGDTHQ